MHKVATDPTPGHPHWMGTFTKAPPPPSWLNSWTAAGLPVWLVRTKVPPQLLLNAWHCNPFLCAQNPSQFLHLVCRLWSVFACWSSVKTTCDIIEQYTHRSCSQWSHLASTPSILNVSTSELCEITGFLVILHHFFLCRCSWHSCYWWGWT